MYSSFSASSRYCLLIIAIPVGVKWYLFFFFWVVKLSLFTDDMIIYVGNSMEPTTKLRELTCKFIKVVGYKINILKLIVFLCISNKQSEIEIKNTIITASKI